MLSAVLQIADAILFGRSGRTAPAAFSEAALSLSPLLSLPLLPCLLSLAGSPPSLSLLSLLLCSRYVFLQSFQIADAIFLL